MLQGKVIWITGALGLVGATSVANFLAKGASVYGTDLQGAENNEEIQALQAQYGQKLVIEISNATDEQQVQNSVQHIKERFGRLDGLFHNAYSQIRKILLEISVDEWNFILNGTLSSVFLTNKYAIPLMMEGNGGAIVNTSSVLSQFPMNNSSIAYSAAKAAVNQFTRIVAVEYAEQGIRANVILPGDIKKPGSAIQATTSLVGRSGRPEEIAELAAYLLSDLSAYVTGALYPIDGGFNLAP